MFLALQRPYGVNKDLLVTALKFQSVVLPNGLIANMYGPLGKLCML